jgi:hypothetical protein
VVAAFASWHESHRSAAKELAGEARLIGQVALESYAVLTRLPPPHRAPSDLVIQFLRENFADRVLVLPARAYMRVLSGVASAGLIGGSVYDAVVGATAAHARATLVTLDRRAATTYANVGASFRFVD